MQVLANPKNIAWTTLIIQYHIHGVNRHHEYVHITFGVNELSTS